MKRLFALLLALALLLSGCEWMNGSYVSITPHPMDYEKNTEDVPSVSSYSDLRSALVGLIDAGSESGLFSLVGYSTDKAQQDMISAVHYATEVYPIGAYAVESLTYEFGTGAGSNALSVDISYRHSKEDIDRIQSVRGISGAEDAIADALSGCQDSLVLQITGYRDADFSGLVAQYAALHPEEVMELPQVTVQTVPAQGSTRIVSLHFTYQTSREELRAMQKKVAPIFSSAALYVNSDADDSTKFAQLYTFLMERFSYTLQSCVTPAYSLLCEGMGDSGAFARVYAAMCRQIGLEALTVSGSRNGSSHCWNMVSVDGVYYHLDLLACTESRRFRLRSDSQMQGYVWDAAEYPPCDTVFRG